MFTYENICAEIERLKEGPMTQSTVSALASLLYIKRHYGDTGEPQAKDLEAGEHGFTRGMVMEWVQGMKNADGTTGPHWTMEKTEEVRVQKGIDCDPLAFYAAMNMIYSDYCKVAEKVNANTMDFYAFMAKAFLDDKDAKNQGAEKLARYYEYVVM